MESRGISRRTAALGLAGTLTVLVALFAFVPATLAADPITLTTPYPGVAAAPGAKVSFDISIKTATPGRVDLTVQGAPEAWKATLHGGGSTVDSVMSQGATATTVTLDLDVPADAAASTQRVTVLAVQGSARASLPLDVRVTPEAAGSVTLTTDFQQLKGTSDATFTFNLTLQNDTPDDLTFTAVANGPAGWTVTPQVSGSSQAASALVKSGSSTAITLTVKAADGAAANTYPITVDATSGSQKAHADLSVIITGSYNLALTTPDGRLSTNASAGGTTDLSLQLNNTGTADVAGVKVTASPPSGWTVKFDQDTVDVPANGSATVTAHITPSTDAIAGDYVTTFNANSDAAKASADIRVTVETSLQWGIVGLGLIVLVIIGLSFVFNRYGRR